MSSTRPTRPRCAIACRLRGRTWRAYASTMSPPTTPGAAITAPSSSPDGGEAPLAAVDFGFNAWGGKYPPWDLDDAVAGAHGTHPGRAALSLRHDPRGGLHRGERRGRADHHRAVPAQPEPQSRSSGARTSSNGCAITWACPRSSGSEKASRATTPTAMWTTSRASSSRTRVLTAMASAGERNHQALETTGPDWRVRLPDGSPLAGAGAADAPRRRRIWRSRYRPATPTSTSPTR